LWAPKIPWLAPLPGVPGRAPELLSHYSDASLPQQFDAYVWFDETSAVTPLGPQDAKPGAPDTYPFGL